MDEAKKQKVMLAVLGVAALGMAAWWLPGLLKGDGGNDAVNTGPDTRRVRESRDPNANKATRKDRNKDRKPRPKAERKMREDTGRKTTERKKRKSGKRGMKKKKKIIPAA